MTTSPDDMLAQPHDRIERPRKSIRVAGMLGYLLATTIVLYWMFRGGDWLLGYLMPLSPWPPRALCSAASIETTTTFYDFTYLARFNSNRLRGREIPPKNRDVFRILVIGDSYAFGWGVNDEEVWVERLNGMFRAAGCSVEVINGGMPGLGPVQYAQRAECLVPELRPDLVLVSILQGGDMVETPTDMKMFPNLRLLVQDWRLRTPPAANAGSSVITSEKNQTLAMERAKEVYNRMSSEQLRRFDLLDDIVKESFFNGRLNTWMIDGSTSSPEHYAGIAQAYDEGRVRMLAHMLTRIGRIDARYGAFTSVVLMPEGPYVNRAALANWRRLGYEMPDGLYGNDVCERMILAACQRARLPVHNLVPAFRQHGDDPCLFFVLDSHMSSAGNRLTAESLFPLLMKQVSELRLAGATAGK